MLQFKQDDTAAVLILTLTELVTLQDPNYLFVFTHALTNDVVAFVKLNIDDESNYPQRYNQFTIDPSVVFDGRQPGEWHYKAYEQASDMNTDPSAAGSLLEQGKMLLDRSEAFAFDMYNSTSSFKTYNG